MKPKTAINVMVVFGLLLGSLVAGSPPSAMSLAAPAATTRYVQPGGTGDCSYWGSTACELQTALSVAVAGDEIWVMAGTYLPDYDPGTETHTGDRNATFQLKSGVAIYGGFAGGETSREERDWEAHATILSGDIGTGGDSGDNSYHVVTGSGVTETAVLDGFAITGGNADGGSGGGMVNVQGSPTLRNLTFSGNEAAGHGGAMYNENSSSPTLTDCEFTNNVADSDGAGGGDGGGMYNALNSSPVLSGTDFFTNTAVLGGGMSNGDSNPVLTNVTFSGNSADGYGGGMYNWQSSPALTDVTFISNTTSTFDGGGMANVNSNPVLTNVTFSDNSADRYGGGVHNSSSNLTLTNCTFNGNTATYGGGMESWYNSPTLTNCTFSGNTATVDGGGMSNHDSNPTLTNVTFSGNTADRYGGGMYSWQSSPTLRNCILWGNVALVDGGTLFNSASTPYIAWSDIEDSGGSLTWDPGLGTDGGGNLDAAPLFVAAAAGDLHLRLDSPAIDVGDNDAVPPGVTTDLDGYPRIGNGRVDMGAYEFQYPEPPSPIYVDAAATGARDGSDWSNALTSLRFALAWAAVGVTEYGLPGVEIWVAGGIYKPDAGADREATFPLHSGVAVYGGYPDTGDPGFGDRNWEAHVTTLSGDLLGNDGPDFANYENSYHVVTGSGTDASAVLDGFTITGGNMDGDFSWGNHGGGMYNDYGSPTLTNVTFSGNTVASETLGHPNGWGGGMANLNYSNPTLTNVTFSDNTANGGGGGMINSNSSPTLTDVTFEGNTGDVAGGGMYNDYSSPTLTDVTFSGNKTEGEWFGAPAGHGGGMYNSDSNPTLTNVTFGGNTAAVAGGAMYNDTSSPTLTGCEFSGNTASDGGGNGGGMASRDNSSPILSDCTFSGNTADWAGGGMYNEENSSPTLTNVDIISNTATKGGGVYNNGGILTGIGVTVISNTATYGGGMYNSDSPAVTHVTLISNTAVYSGGGMYNDGGAPTLNAIALTLNIAQDGGGMYNDGSSPAGRRITFTHNTATTSGGGMYSEASGPVLANARFVSNTATYGGGGMYNRDCTIVSGFPRLVNTLFNNNAATGTAGNEGSGGAMYNEGSQPELVNVTFGSNTATQYGGGMANFASAAGPSTPRLDNCVLWGNTSGSGTPEQDQIYDHEDGSQAIVGSTCTVEGSQAQASPFVDADGADGIPGTADDDLCLAYTSDAIDGGDETQPLLVDILDLDGDGNTTEELPFDLDGHVRRYADENLDGIPDPVGAPYSDRRVDQGAYEAGCYAWHMHYGADWLAEGQDYRLGFHHEIDDPSTVTISDTLASYAAERAAGNLSDARKAYELALDCATTVTETNQALAGLLKVIWEQATGALLEGNEEMVTALDLTDAGGMAIEITALGSAIDLYTEATDGYLLPLAGEHQGDFLAAMGISRTQQLTYTEAITQVDVQRLAAASAKKNRATLELAERQFRSGDRAEAEETLRQGKAQATVELALLEEIWAGVVEDVNYHALLRCLSDMDRLLGFLVGDKNALGYSPEWIPIHYRPGIDENNYLRVNELAEEKLGIGDHWGAQDVIDLAAAESQKVHDTYSVMQQRYADIEAEYDDELEQMCGADGGEPDLTRCAGGSIATQISAVEQAQLRLGRVLEQMNVLNKRILIEVDARAEAAGIYEATAELMDPEGERCSSLGEQEDTISKGFKAASAVGHVVSNMVYGKAIGAMAFGRKGALGKAGALLAGLGGAIDTLGGFLGFGGGGGPSKEEQLLEFQAWQNAEMVICEGQIADVEFEKRIKELFLEFGLLDIDYAITLENLHQELLRLEGMKTRVEYLLAEKARALAFTTLLYRDPAHRVLRDYYMELAQDSYDTGLDFTFRAGRALEYEANLTSAEFEPPYIPPDPDEMFGIRNIVTLISERADTKTAYDDWSADKTPHTYVTDDPYPKILLSRALNYEDTEIPGIGPVTAEEQFNAYVVRNPANRYDLDEDGVAESLYFVFDTSVHKGNPFFDHCLFNDRIESVKMRMRGADLGKTSVTVRLGWGDTGCQDTECGTTFIRSEEAFMTDDGFGNWLDDLRAYKVQPKLATIQAVTGDVAFPPGAENYDLATRSVANPNWTFFFDGTLPANEGLNLDNVDEIELIIEHEAYSSQAPMCQGPPGLRLAPSRDYQPMERVLDPGSSPLLVALGEDHSLSAEDATTSLSGLYAGTVAITSPQYMPALDMNLVLTETGGSLTGYLDAAQSLHVPVVDGATGHGPAVSGSWSGEGFSLESELFTTTLSLGLTVTRQVILHSGVISNSGEYLTGLYSETLAGLTPEPMVIYGDVELWRLPAAVAPSASFGAFPVIGPVALTVTFSDYSTGDPTGWLWDFGDGGISTEQHPTHTYTALGTYTVTLTVSNTLGTDTVVMPSYITVVDKTKIYLPLVMRSWP